MRFWLLLLVPPLPLIFAGYIIIGLAVGPINPILSTVQQEIIPAAMRARVFGVVSAWVMAGVPPGGLLTGYLVQWIDILPSLAVVAVCYLVATLILLVNPSLKSMDRPIP
jgi:MFS family permease